MSPNLLPLITGVRHGSRSHLTCQLKCGNACDQPVPNQSGNDAMADVVSRAIARRSVLKGSAVGAGALVIGGLATSAAAASEGTGAAAGGRGGADVGTAPFTPVPPNIEDDVVTAPEFQHAVVIRWGDPVEADAPAFDVTRQTPEAQATQFGYNNDYVGILPLDGRRALLVTNHEYTDEYLMFPTGSYDDATIKRIALAAHGMSVVAIERGAKPGSWVRSDHRKSRHNRRITAHTEFTVSGPAAGHDLLKTDLDPTGTVVLGTLNNCAGGTTPWGTVLSGEENFNQYFDASGPVDPALVPALARYGLRTTEGLSDRAWSQVDERFDLAKHPHEPHRFGWVVEIDPMDPTSTPVKHTMLGRFKHEGANVTVAKSGHVVAYMGDDERGDYIYKFVSRDTYRADSSPVSRRHNMGLLSAGTLYVARYEGDGSADGVYDGTGQWIALTSDTESFVPGMSVAEVLVFTRLAADKVGPTKMDRPEDVEPNPVNGRIYAALTNNSNRGTRFAADEANPVTESYVRTELGGPLVKKAGNRNGYVLEMTEDGGDHTATTFTWDLFLVCGDPEAPETYFGGYDTSKVSMISCPDNVAFDGAGNLWIATDGAQLGSHDGLFRVPVDGPERGNVQQLLTVPVGAETCGPLITEDQRSVFIAVQHPGETDGASFENPSSTWPHTDGFPRPSIAVAYRK
ncbi:PhoX family phosphatase [Intrasporangium sp. DVR]|uniref:PhoX family protein n=1 Tax=Intrasporangium sp. DVR TaxID=3127867 RepID=UPI00313A72C1